MNVFYILAERNNDSTYSPVEVYENNKFMHDDLEYGDVHEGLYQLWEYPSGKIYQIESDREVEEKNYYSLPGSNLWTPKLRELTIDKEKVKEAYGKLTDKL